MNNPDNVENNKESLLKNDQYYWSVFKILVYILQKKANGKQSAKLFDEKINKIQFF